MRDSFTPEEVTRIEDKAYEVGVSVGEYKERIRILDIVASQICDCTLDCGRLDTTVEKMISLIKEENE